jgi:hypothetical protein
MARPRYSAAPGVRLSNAQIAIGLYLSEAAVKGYMPDIPQ